MLDAVEIEDAIQKKDASRLAQLIKNNQLKLQNNKITADDQTIAKASDFWDRRQLIKKILLNSLYGSLGNSSSAWFDARIAQSTTLTGRCIVRHMAAKINEVIEGKYDHTGKAIVYGDSVTGDTLIRTDQGDITIAQLYDECLEHAKLSNGKEYGLWSSANVIGFNGHDMEPVMSGVEAVMRHKTRKKLYRITTANGKHVTVTEDHSLMVDRDGFLMEVKPMEMREDDVIITLATQVNH
jgi:DNA polymerase elongation subunit (family B)